VQLRGRIVVHALAKALVHQLQRLVQLQPQHRLADLGGPRQTWVTGALFAPTLRAQAAEFAAATGLNINIIAVPNRTFGETVTVAGLLTVEDVIAALRAAPPADVIILPDEMFRGPEGCSLDGQYPTMVTEALGGTPCVVVSDNLLLNG